MGNAEYMGTHPIFESDFDCLTEMFTRSVTRSLSASAALNKKVAVLGAAGGIGQPLALLLKCNTSVTGVNVYDVAPVTPGVGADLSHIDTRANVESFVGDDLEAAVAGCDVVLIPAGVPRKPGMTRDDLFNTNATIVANLTRACAKAAPNVVGGHAGITIIPVLSQVVPKGIINHLSTEEINTLTERIQNAGTEVVKAKAGGGSATLSMAYAAARFADSVIRAMNGEEVVECAYIPTTGVAGVDVEYFSTPILLNADGTVKENLGLGALNDYESGLVTAAQEQLKGEIAKGVEFAANFN